MSQALLGWTAGARDVRAQDLGLRYQGTPDQQYVQKLQTTKKTASPFE